MSVQKPKAQQIAETLGKSVEAMAIDLAKIALWLEGNKNRGTEAEDLAAAGLDVALLDPLYVDAWQDILFHAVPDRRSFYKGWYVRRTPTPWFDTFKKRYGKEGSAWHTVLEAAHQAALEEREARKVWRKLENFAGHELEKLDTRTIAYWSAVADVLGCRAMARSLHSAPIRQMLMSMYSDAVQALRGELTYRTKSDPQEQYRQSKRKRLLMKADWSKARQYLEDGTNHFFDADYVMYCMMQETEPDLTVDFDRLPRMPTEKMPVMWQSDKQVMQTFLQFVNTATEGSFEAEDVALMVKTLRPLLARVKGQKVAI